MITRLRALLRPAYRQWKRVEWHIRNVFRTYIESSRFPFDTTKPMPPTSAEWLRKCCDTLEQHNIRYALGWGTALGIIRDHRIIPHDTDLDVNLIDVQDRASVERIITGLGMTLGRRVMVRERMFAPKRIEQLVFYSPDHVKIDLLFWDTRQKGPLLRNLMDREYIIQHPRQFFEELGSVEFQGKRYSVPADTEGYLQNLYGPDWKTPRSFKNVDWRTECKALVKRA